MSLSRRQFMQVAGISCLPFIFPGVTSFADAPSLLKKPIPASGEQITTVGMGTWQTFNVGSDALLRQRRVEIVKLFFALGGQVIDSSPMYGSSQAVVGYALQQLNYPAALFSAEKVWTYHSDETRKDIQSTAGYWGVNTFDLMQVHNLLSWQEHLPKLLDMKRNGELRYVGITTSHGRRHRELELIMRDHPIDFVQLTYNLIDRKAEARLLPLAQEKGIAIIVNRPFQGGSLIRRIQSKKSPLPDFAAELGCQNWPQLLLTFIISHPAVTCVIPATTQLEHMRENMGAATGRFADKRERQMMQAYLQSL